MDTYNELKIEIQIRTFAQHVWATAVETVDTFTRQALKGGGGEDDWRHFFVLMSSAIAMREQTSLVPGAPTDGANLRKELLEYERKLRVRDHLKSWGKAFQSIEAHGISKAHYYLLELDIETEKLSVTGYRFADSNQATQDLLRIERETMDKNADAVIVSAESLDALRRAYPNYYMDTELFVGTINEVLG